MLDKLNNNNLRPPNAAYWHEIETKLSHAFGGGKFELREDRGNLLITGRPGGGKAIWLELNHSAFAYFTHMAAKTDKTLVNVIVDDLVERIKKM